MAKIPSAVGSGITERLIQYNTRTVNSSENKDFLDEKNSLKAKGNRVNRPRVSVATDCALPNRILRNMERMMAKIKPSRIPTRTYAELGWIKNGLR
jgi:hypothetical protein